MADEPILIVGAGLAGLAMAIALARQGRSVHVLERTSAFSEIGAGVQIGPNAIRALKAIGAWQAAADCINYPPAVIVRDAHNGRVLERMELDHSFAHKFGEPYGVAQRAALHTCLLSLTKSLKIPLQRDADVTSIASHHDRIQVSCKSGATYQGHALIGTDGINSAVRQLSFNGAPAQTLPFTIHRFTAPLPLEAAGVDMDCVNLWMGPGWHAVHYPVSTALLNVVLTVDGGMRPPPQVMPAGMAHIIAASSPLGVWPAQRAGHLSQWYRDNICLAGDAAHGTVPFLAQGAAMAFEDAQSMADAIASHPPAKAFRQFEAMRRKRCDMLDARSRRSGTIYHAKGLLAAARNAAFHVPGFSPTHFALRWLYSHNRDKE